MKPIEEKLSYYQRSLINQMRDHLRSNTRSDRDRALKTLGKVEMLETLVKEQKKEENK